MIRYLYFFTLLFLIASFLKQCSRIEWKSALSMGLLVRRLEYLAMYPFVGIPN